MLNVGPRKPGVPSREEMYKLLKQRSIDLQRLGQDEVDRLELEGRAGDVSRIAEEILDMHNRSRAEYD